MSNELRHPNHHPLHIPRQWIEDRLEQTDADLSHRHLNELQQQKESIPADESVSWPQESLTVSFLPERIQEFANRLTTTADRLLAEVSADLADGIAMQSTSWTSRDGNKIQVLSVRWRLVLRPQRGKKTGVLLAVLDGLSQLAIPTGQHRFVPRSVQFSEVWNELPCDLESLLKTYESCKQELRERRQARRRLGDELRYLHERRREAERDVSRQLRRSQTDAVFRTRSQLHGVVRRQYSALRVMMDLLHLRSEQERHRFLATVTSPEIAQTTAAEGELTSSKRLRLALNDSIPDGLLSEESLVEIVQPGQSRPKRARVQSIVEREGAMVLELDLPPSTFDVGQSVEVNTVSRFGMWAHQRSVHQLLEEQVEGYWPDLAKLLCSPQEIANVPENISTVRFFCDSERGRASLNERQRAAVAGAVGTHNAFCIQGPPGTGKTTVICEIIQQLIARGERILVLAPTHVAVDEVLRRIGSLSGVRALRLSWDDSKVADDVRKFTPANIIDPFLDTVRSAPLRGSRWNGERGAIADSLVVLQQLEQVQERMSAAALRLKKAETQLEAARHSLSVEDSALKNELNSLRATIQTTEAEIARLREDADQAETASATLRAQAGWGATVLGWIGLGPVGQATRHQSQIESRLHVKDREQGSHRQKEESVRTRLEHLLRAVADSEDGAAIVAMEVADLAREATAAEVNCQKSPLIKNAPTDAGSTRKLIEQLRIRDKRLAGYERLGGRFDKIVADAKGEDQDLDGLRKDLLAVTNLFCCTTTGVAGNSELRDLVFDTLIVDEASRVTDSEFLIGAAKARRWILVGDEHQLPPYVEQNDEHFLHALSALHQAEASSGSLDTVVDQLGALWEEDEELHRFRRDSVLTFAKHIHESGNWESTYRKPYHEGIDYLRADVDEPARALLRAMRDSLVHSLFERVVQACPPAMKVRLVEQRRMIEPIAAIVRDSVYGGDYQTPSPEDLARHGITPLVTPSFPTPVTFLDTSLLGPKARDEMVRNSFVNRTEARWIVEACRVLDRELSQSGVGQVTVSILAFYKAQARIIRDQLAQHRFQRLHFSVIDAIDRIQGQESDLVFLSFCRTGGKTVSEHFGQWLQDVRRLNVACTRAHRALIFVGQRELLSRLRSNEQAIQFYRNLNDLFQNRPDVMRVVKQFGGEQ